MTSDAAPYASSFNPADHVPLPRTQMWSAVGSMGLCVALLIASEFMPVSLLTPIARDLGATEGMAGQAISISGLFAVVTAILITPLAGHYNRRRVLLAMTGMMLLSLVLTAQATTFATLMVARSMLGVTIGGFWALSTATVMRLVPEKDVPKALGVLFMGNAVATTFAAPIGAYLGESLGWRGVFAAMVPFAGIALLWQLFSLPSLPPRKATPVSNFWGLLKRRYVALALAGLMLTFAGAFSAFTYFRPFLEQVTGVDTRELSLLLLGLGGAGFVGTLGASLWAGRFLYRLLYLLPLSLALVTASFLFTGTSLVGVAIGLILWGAVNSAVPVTWSTWLAREVRDEPETAGGLMVAATQLAIMLGAGLGGLLLDSISLVATFLGASAMLIGAAVVTGRGNLRKH